MCHAKPGDRCHGDASTAVETHATKYATALSDLNEISEKKPTDPATLKKWQAQKDVVNAAAYKLREKVDFYYSTNAAQTDGAEKTREMKKILKEHLSDKEITALRISQMQARKTGKVINSFQQVFNGTMQSDPDKNHLANTRMMVNGVYQSHQTKLLSNAKNNYSKKIDELSKQELSLEDLAKKKQSVRLEYIRNKQAINAGYTRAQADAMSVVKKDCDANSQGYNNSITKVRTAYIKNTDGTFTVTSFYDVEGRNFEDVVAQNEASYRNETVQSTYKPVEGKKNTYAVMSRYVYNGGGEKLADVEKHHKDKAWRGTPQWRRTMAQVKYIDENYF